MNIWVLLGGMSAEREVALDSGIAVAQALGQRGHHVWAYDLRDGLFRAEHSTELPPIDPMPPRSTAESPELIAPPPGWAERLLGVAGRLRGRADVAFLALHGGEGENGTVQTLLSSVGMPYTGSGSLASAVAMSKVLSKWIMESLDIPTPAWKIVRVPAGAAEVGVQSPAGPVLDLPAVVKPVAQGSSVGVSIVREVAEWEPALKEALRVTPTPPDGMAQVLVEEYVPGRELTVAMLDETPLPVVEIEPRTGFYDYKRKYSPGETRYTVPAQIEVEVGLRLQDHALRLFRALGCRGMARVDFRYTPQGKEYCLELNTIPGLTSTSLVPKAAAAAGYTFGEFLEEICRLGLA